ncbi:hypothetical protein Tsubulata_039316 [Turnera subulata]|uniref:Uncharacterized protein n=1 Tax=Turnera subulata TaxID=218843 RepID=A0A9Q0F6P4_9ROSI|nr:hypothetical protein Tsubulata_039316 [Turnera subulata]
MQNSIVLLYSVQKIGTIIRRSTHELDLDDQASVRMWVERNKKSIFFYQDSSEAEPFILGIQTEWQLQQMIRFGHHSLIAADSTFGIKRLQYPLCTLLVFDSTTTCAPCCIGYHTSSAKPDVAKWMKALLDRASSAEPGWKISGFLIDDAAAEIDPIRQDMDIFGCPALLLLWRLRRSWLRNIVKRCTHVEVQREIFKRLGKIVHGIWSGDDVLAAMEELTHDFVDQTAFMQYFKASWIPKIEMWLSTMRSLPLASQEACGAIEPYHVKLKAKLFQRVDWLVHKLTTELHSSCWLDWYADESDSFQNAKEEYIASTSWNRALQIPDSAVTFDDKDRLFAKVSSQENTSVAHIVWNPGSEFAFCDCAWSLQGNFFKHAIKVNMICQDRESYQPSMPFQSFKEILTNLLRKPVDDSISLDLSMAWTHQMLDQIGQLVELNSSNDIRAVVNKMPVKWVSKKDRTSVGIPSSIHALPAQCMKAKHVLGWTPEFDLVEGLTDSYNLDFGGGTFRKEADFPSDDLILGKSLVLQA